ncbi:MAG: ABC transporter permease [Gemmatimonadaceae bacterium]
MRLRRALRLSVNALAARRIRAVLALASVSTGVAAIVLAAAVGEGVEVTLRREMDALGVNLLIVRPAAVQRSVARAGIRGSVRTLRLDDAEAVAGLPTVAHAAPAIDAPVRVIAGGAAMRTKVLGTTPNYPLIRRYEVARGRFFSEEENERATRVVVLGARVAATLFGDRDPIGSELRVGRVPFEVIGVLAAKGTLADGDEDDQVVVPLRTALRRVINASWLNAIYVSVVDREAMPAAEAQIRELMRWLHASPRDARADFEVQDVARFFAGQQRTAATLRALTLGLAALALVVGGAGVMVVMLLSVRERTREIGLRVAVGATPRAIVTQFLLEATLLSLAGWVIGIVVAAGGGQVIAATTAWPVAPPPGALLLSLCTALAIGIGFGAVPARSAARIPPLRALLAG